MDYLRVCGCLCYFSVTNFRVPKLGPMALKGVFIDYAED